MLRQSALTPLVSSFLCLHLPSCLCCFFPPGAILYHVSLSLSLSFLCGSLASVACHFPPLCLCVSFVVACGLTCTCGRSVVSLGLLCTHFFFLSSLVALSWEEGDGPKAWACALEVLWPFLLPVFVSSVLVSCVRSG